MPKQANISKQFLPMRGFRLPVNLYVHGSYSCISFYIAKLCNHSLCNHNRSLWWACIRYGCP